jgi:hypothetical protein
MFRAAYRRLEAQPQGARPEQSIWKMDHTKHKSSQKPILQPAPLCCPPHRWLTRKWKIVRLSDHLFIPPRHFRKPPQDRQQLSISPATESKRRCDLPLKDFWCDNVWGMRLADGPLWGQIRGLIRNSLFFSLVFASNQSNLTSTSCFQRQPCHRHMASSHLPDEGELLVELPPALRSAWCPDRELVRLFNVPLLLQSEPRPVQDLACGLKQTRVTRNSPSELHRVRLRENRFWGQA